MPHRSLGDAFVLLFLFFVFGIPWWLVIRENAALEIIVTMFILAVTGVCIDVYVTFISKQIEENEIRTGKRLPRKRKRKCSPD